MPETTDKRPLKVFLCHASADKPKVRELYRTLKRRGVQPWLDAENLIPGQNWEVEIPKALLSSDAIIICLSPSSVDKEGYVQKEIKFALDKALEMPEGRIFIIPARLDDCDLPFSLRQYQAVNLYEKEGYTKLMKALKLRASQLERITVELPKEGEIAPEIKKVVEEKKSVASEQEKPETKTFESSSQSVDLGGLNITGGDNVINIGIQEKPILEQPEAEHLQPKKARPSRKLNTAIIVALIGLAGTIIAALLGSPVFGNLFSPTSAPTGVSTVTITLTIPPITPSQTIEPNPTLTETITPTPTLLPAEITDAQGISMHLVPAREFIMGFSADEANNFCQTIVTHIVYYGSPCRKEDYLREEPVHKVYLNNFFIDVYEVSNEEYKKCVTERVCAEPASKSNSRYSNYYDNEYFSNYPVININWDMAKTYCDWRGARLPTEAEWEKAARGTDGRTHPWENYNPAYRVYDPTFYVNKANIALSNTGGPMSIDSNSQGLSPYGLYNMAGNVAEWVADWYGETYYGESPYNGPLGPTVGDYKVVRGGSVNTNEIRTTARVYRGPNEYDSGIGIRCAKDATP